MEHLQQNNLLNGERANYLLIKVNNVTLDNKLLVITDDRSYQQKIAWNLIHISLSFFHTFGPFFGNEKFDSLHGLFNCFHENIVEILSLDFSIISYHAVIATFGHIEEGETFAQVIEHFTVLLESPNPPQEPLILPIVELQELPYPNFIMNGQANDDAE